MGGTILEYTILKYHGMLPWYSSTKVRTRVPYGTRVPLVPLVWHTYQLVIPIGMVEVVVLPYHLVVPILPLVVVVVVAIHMCTGKMGPMVHVYVQYTCTMVLPLVVPVSVPVVFNLMLPWYYNLYTYRYNRITMEMVPPLTVQLIN
jgi:hypothetical protein